MKANRITSRNRILTTLGLLTIVISLGYSQGYFADNTIRSIDSYELLVAQMDFDHNPETHIPGAKNLAAAALSYEAELETEKWMTTPLENSLEANAVEAWMTNLILESLESNVEFEGWMSVSFTESTEQELTVEDWMTQSLISE